MKFLKVLVNSLLCGFFFSVLLSILFYNLNINLDFRFVPFGQLTLFLGLSYGILISILSLFLFYLFHFFSSKKNRLTLVSPPFLAAGFTVLLLFFLLIFKENYDYFLSFFDEKTRSLLRIQMISLFCLSMTGLVIMYAFLRRKKRTLLFSVYFLLWAATTAFVVKLRMDFPSWQKPEKAAVLEARKIDKKLVIIGMEGLSFDFIIPLISEEKLPNFSWLVEGGSWGRLANFSPNEAFILNNSFNTGRYPSNHRQISLPRYQIWNIKEDFEVAPRFILFKQLTRVGLLKLMPKEPTPKTKDIWEILADNKTTVVKRDRTYSQEIIKPGSKSEKLFTILFKDLQYETSSIITLARQVFIRDCEMEDMAWQERNQVQPQFFYFMLNGLNIVETFFYKYSFPELFGTIDHEEISKYSTVIERYYQFYDQIIGKYLASLKEDELLVVFSPHGIEPLPLWKRFVEWLLGNPAVSAYHEYAPDGVIFFYGKGIVRGQNIEGMKLVDVAPTLLYYLNLPVGKDMDGIVQSSLFLKEYTAENPIFFITSYEETIIQ